MNEVIGNYEVIFTPRREIVMPLSKRTATRLQRRGPPMYVQEFIARKRQYMGWVYLIHFDTPYKHAKHYLGFSRDVSLRELRHRADRGSNLVKVVTEAGISWRIVRVWYGDRYLERKMKNSHNAPRYCPICRENNE